LVSEQFCDIAEHIYCCHDQAKFHPCEECEFSFPTSSTLEAHIVNDHDRIPQLDGPILANYDFSDINILADVPGEIRTKNYAFNKTKQMKEIKRDAKIVDFEVKVNNEDENCTIKCSSGFYIQVARSCFSSIDKTTVLTIDNVAITIQDVKISMEKNDHEVNRLIHFLFYSKMQPHGGVKVHLHHSTSTIQVQGGSIMPDSTKAALWFLNKVIVKKFKEQAKAKKYAIKNINEVIQGIEAPSNLVRAPNSCQSCNRSFNTQSKPSMCSSCSKFFHKINCLKDHLRFCSPRPSSCSSLPPLSSSAPSSWPPEASGSTSRTLAPSRINPEDVHLPLSSSLAIPGLQTSISFVPPAQPLPSAQISSLLPRASPCQPQNPDTSASGNTVPVAKKKVKITPTSKQDISTDFLQRELVAAQTRITQLDATISDKEKQVSILLARVKAFEEKENTEIYEKYFPPSQPRSHQSQSPPVPAPACSPCSHTSTTSRSKCCSLPPPTCHSARTCFDRPACTCMPLHGCSQCQVQHSPDTDVKSLFLKIEIEVNDLRSKLDEFKAELCRTNKSEQSQPTNPCVDPVKNVIPDDAPAQQEADHQPPQTEASDLSMASVEEFIPDNPHDSLPLN
jgi:hypothetical protein